MCWFFRECDNLVACGCHKYEACLGNVGWYLYTGPVLRYVVYRLDLYGEGRTPVPSNAKTSARFLASGTSQIAWNSQSQLSAAQTWNLDRQRTNDNIKSTTSRISSSFPIPLPKTSHDAAYRLPSLQYPF